MPRATCPPSRHGRLGFANMVVMQVRRAHPADAPVILETVTDAFHHDPTWSYVFSDPIARPAQYRRWWPLFIDGALRYDASWVADEGAAVAIWIPPGGNEMSDEEEARIEPLLRELLGERADLILPILDRFAAAHPYDEPHYYLTLLATRSDRRGKGLGMALLRHCLAYVDVEHAPVYLESSNPANDARYEGAGFVRREGITMPDGHLTVATMWRPARQ